MGLARLEARIHGVRRRHPRRLPRMVSAMVDERRAAAVFGVVYLAPGLPDQHLKQAALRLGVLDPDHV